MEVRDQVVEVDCWGLDLRDLLEEVHGSSDQEVLVTRPGTLGRLPLPKLVVTVMGTRIMKILKTTKITFLR